MADIKIETQDLPKIGSYKYFDYPVLRLELLIWQPRLNEFKVYSSFCPHFGGQLFLKDGHLQCPIHAYTFDSESGKCLNRDFGGSCKMYEYSQVADGIVLAIQ